MIIEQTQSNLHRFPSLVLHSINQYKSRIRDRKQECTFVQLFFIRRTDPVKRKNSALHTDACPTQVNKPAPTVDKKSKAANKSNQMNKYEILPPIKTERPSKSLEDSGASCPSKQGKNNLLMVPRQPSKGQSIIILFIKILSTSS